MSLLILIFSSILSAAVRPEIPLPETDRTLTQNLTARAFFSKKNSNVACVNELNGLKTNYRALRRQLISLKTAGVSADQLDSKERESLSVLKTMITKLEVCGECSTQEVQTKTIKTAEKTEVWSVADGSCQIPTEDKTLLDSIFQKSTEDLLNIQKYGAQREGFASLLEFVAMDYSTGELLPNVGKIPSPSKLHTYIAVKGPVAPLVGLMGFQYVGMNDVVTREKNGLKELIITLRGVSFPDGFEAPVAYAVTAGGRKTRVSMRSLINVQAQWYLNSDGYSRYYTAADFGHLGNLPSLKAFARETLINTLSRQMERSLGEP